MIQSFSHIVMLKIIIFIIINQDGINQSMMID